MMANQIIDLNTNEIEVVSGGDGCDVVAGIGGALLGGIAGVATTAFAGPIAGVFMAAVIGGGASGSISTICKG
jgi:hypothetical protein